MDNSACSTCAKRYSDARTAISEKPLLVGRELPCCGRSICARCLNQNKRYETYCPYCQITTEPSLLPQGLKDPPAYSSLEENRLYAATASRSLAPNHDDGDDLPAYSARNPSFQARTEKIQESAPDVLHFVTPNDSMHALALAYDIPIDALRKTNNLFADNLLQGRRTILIPGAYYKGGVSLSPRPVDGEEEEARKQKIRRWMVSCKVADYDVALLYLQQAEWDLETAVHTYQDDERWEKEHPLEARKAKKGKAVKEIGMQRFVGGTG